MKTVQYDLRIIHRKKVAIGAINRKEIDRILQDMITSGEALNMEGGEVVGIVVEEKGERDCPGDCDHCPYLCPENEDCMMDDLEDTIPASNAFGLPELLWQPSGSLSGKIPETL